MKASLASELRKLTTVRTTWALTAIGLAVVSLSTSSYVFGEPVDAAFGTARRTATAIDVIGTNSLMVLVVGVLVITAEFRHATIGRTLQLTPRRAQVLTVKLAAAGCYGAAFFAAGVAITAGMLAIQAFGSGTTLVVGGVIAGSLWRNLVAMTLTGALGVAVGAVVRSQVVAITASMLWVFLVENLVISYNYQVGRWLPFQALNAIHFSAVDRAAPGVRILPLTPAVGLLVFMAYVVVLSSIAGVLMTRRDV